MLVIYKRTGFVHNRFIKVSTLEKTDSYRWPITDSAKIIFYILIQYLTLFYSFKLIFFIFMSLSQFNPILTKGCIPGSHGKTAFLLTIMRRNRVTSRIFKLQEMCLISYLFPRQCSGNYDVDCLRKSCELMVHPLPISHNVITLTMLDTMETIDSGSWNPGRAGMQSGRDYQKGID